MCIFMLKKGLSENTKMLHDFTFIYCVFYYIKTIRVTAEQSKVDRYVLVVMFRYSLQVVNFRYFFYRLKMQVADTKTIRNINHVRIFKQISVNAIFFVIIYHFQLVITTVTVLNVDRFLSVSFPFCIETI
jgi:hypothetical protein